METSEFRRKRPGEISLLTYNIFGGVGLSTLLQELSSLSEKPDLICFQEYPQNGRERELLEKFFDGDYLHESFFSFSLRERTLGLCVFYKKGLGRLLEKRTISLPPSGLYAIEKILMRAAVGSSKAWTREALLIRLEIRGKPLNLVNTHLAWEIFGQSKKEQIQFLLKGLSSEIGTESVLISGDFNLRQDSQNYPAVLSELTAAGFNQLTTAVTKSYNPLSRLSFPEDKTALIRQSMLAFLTFFKLLRPLKIDYIFGRNVESNFATSLPFNGSDHYPLLAYFHLG